MGRALALGVGLGLLFSSGAGTELDQAVPRIAAAASQIHSLYFKGTVAIALDEDYVRVLQKRGNKVPEYVQQQKAVVEYFYHEGLSSFGVEHTYGNGKVLGSVVKCWDGTCHQTFFRHSGLLSISQKPEKLENRYWWLLQGNNLPFMPYGFLNPGMDQIDKEQAGRGGMLWVHPDGVAALDNWKRVLQAAVPQKPAPEQKGIVCRINYPHAYDLVTFAPPDYFPVAFTRHDTEDRKMREYEVLETRKIPLDGGHDWPVPVQARYRWYEGPVLMRTDLLKIEDVAINGSAKFDPSSQFFIDPVMAERVYDADNDKVIQVPR